MNFFTLLQASLQLTDPDRNALVPEPIPVLDVETHSQRMNIQEVSMPENANEVFWKANFWSSLGARIKKGAEDTAIAMVTSATANFLRFNPSELEELKLRNKERLRAIAGCDHLNNLLIQLVPAMMEQLSSELEQEEDRVIREYLKGQLNSGGLLHSVFQMLLTQVVCNLAMSSTDNGEETSGNARVLAILPRLCETGEEYLPDITSAMENLLHVNPSQPLEHERTRILNLHQVEIRNAFGPLGKALLVQALPGGKNEIPLVAPFDMIIWKLIKNRLLPDALFNMYWAATYACVKPEQEALLAVPHGELFDCISEGIPHVIQAFGLPLLKASSALIADKILEVAPTAIGDKEDAREWLKNLFKMLADGNSPAVQRLISYGGHTAQAIFSSLVIKLSNSSQGHIPLFDQLYEAWTAFEISSSQHIVDAFSSSDFDESAMNDPEVSSLFAPLCSQMLEMIGIGSKTDLDLPEGLQDLVHKRLMSTITTALISFSFTMHKQKSKTLATEALLESHYGVDYQRISSVLNQFVETSIDKLSGNSSLLSDVACRTIQHQMQQWSLGGGVTIPSYLEESLPRFQALISDMLAEPPEALKGILRPVIRALSCQHLAEELNLQPSAADSAMRPEARANIAINVLNGLGSYFADLTSQRESLDDQAYIDFLKLPSFIVSEDQEQYTILQKDLEDSKSALFDLLDRYEETQDLESLRAGFLEANLGLQETKRRLDDLQKKSLQGLAAAIIPLAGVGPGDDFGVPEPFATALRNILSANLLPEILGCIYNFASDAKTMNSILLNVINGISNDTETSEILANGADESSEVPNDELQEDLKAACDGFISNLISLSAGEHQGIILNSQLLRRPLVSLVAGKMRQALTRSFFEESLEVFSQQEAVTEEIRDSSDRECDPVLNLIQSLREERQMGIEIDTGLYELFNDGISQTPMFALESAWKLLLRKIDGSLSILGVFGRLIKCILQFVVEIVFFQIICTALSIVLRFVHAKGMSLAEPLVRERIRSLRETIHSNMNKSLLFRVTNDIVSCLREAQAESS